MAALEEYLQEKYVEYYDEANNYNSKPELLASKIKNLFLQDGTNDYIVFGGEKYYLINKASLPKEVKDGLIGGNTTEWAKYIRLEDVYGVTSDLKVFYCDKSTGTEYGVLEGMAIDATQPSKKINDDIGGVKDSIAAALKTMGIDVSERDITLADIAKIKDLTLDQTTSTSTITNLSALAEMRDLQTLTLSNLTLSNLDGLEYCTNLYYIYFKNCKIGDYSKLCYNWELEYIYMYLPPSMETDDANDQVTALGNGLHDASNLKKVANFGIAGSIKCFETTDFSPTGTGWSASEVSQVTNISGLSNINNSIKNSIQYLNLNQNKFSSVSSLEGFTNIIRLNLQLNKELLNLDGVENKTTIEQVWLAYCSKLEDIEGLLGCTSVWQVTIHNCDSLVSLHGLESSTALSTIYIWGTMSGLTDITAIEGKSTMRTLYLNQTTNLVHVSTLGTLTGLKYLYMNATSYDKIEVRDALANPTTRIAANCITFQIASKYQEYFLDSYTEFDLSVAKKGLLTDTSDEITILKYKTKVKRLNLTGQTQLTNGTLQDFLSTMTGLEALCLNGVSQLSSIDFIGEYETEDEDGNTIIVDKVKNLKELDLRGTSRSLTDLSNLNEYGKSIIRLLVDNPAINVTLMQTAISNIAKQSQEDYSDSWINSGKWTFCGTAFCGEDVENNQVYNFSECTSITNFRGVAVENVASGILFENLANLDFSSCNNISIQLSGDWGNVVMPSRTGSINSVKHMVDISNCDYIQTLNTDWWSETQITNLFSNVKKSLEIGTLQFVHGTTSTLGFLDKFDCSKLIYLSFSGNVSENHVLVSSLKGIGKCTSLITLRVTEDSFLTSLEDLEEFETSSIVRIDVRNCSNLLSLSGIEACSNATEILFGNSGINDLSGIEGHKFKYFTEFCSGTFITDLSPLEGCIWVGTDGNNKFNATSLNFYNTPLKGTAENGHNNLETLRKLHDAGLKKINIYRTNFSNTDKQTLISIFGEANVTMDEKW